MIITDMTSESTQSKANSPDYKQALRDMLIKSIYEKKTKYRMLNKYAVKGQIVFTGSTLMEAFPIDEMQQSLGLDKRIYNRGIGGATTSDLLGAMDECIFDLEPAKLFINIGSSDMNSVYPGNYRLETLLENYGKILDAVKSRLPYCRVYVMAYYPVNSKDEFGLDKHQKRDFFLARNNEMISQANAAIEKLAYERCLYFINVNEGLTDEDGDLKKEFTLEGIHLWPNAYAVILENLKEYLR